MSDDGMSDAEFDAKVGFPVGERYVPKSKLDAAEARATAASEWNAAIDAAVEALNERKRLICEGAVWPAPEDIVGSLRKPTPRDRG